MTNSNSKSVVVANPWTQLRQYTAARIALGRAGTSLPTKPHLDFQLAHARARNAVHHELEVEKVQSAIKAMGHEVVLVQSAAENRPMYLQRPDKGRQLNDASREGIRKINRAVDDFDVVFVVADGLSSFAIEENATPFLEVILPRLTQKNWRIAPLVLALQGRVAIGDEIGEILGAGMVVVLIGERPGLSSPDSMGIYMTLKPRKGLTDESRNCISNVRREGLSYPGAAHKLIYLMSEARQRGISGVNLKDEAGETLGPVTLPRRNFLTDQS